jgi:diguanylate cyclase (GGDEF)-like protein
VTSVPNSLDPTSPARHGPASAGATARGFAPVEAFLARSAEPPIWRPGLAGRLAVGRRDPVNLLSLSLALAVATVTVVRGPASPWPALLATASFVALEMALAMIGRSQWQWPILIVRFGLALAFIVVADLLVDPAGGWPFNALMIPVVALAAAQNERLGWLVVGALMLAFLPGYVMGEHSIDLTQRLIAWSFAAIVSTIGTRRVVSSLQRSRDRLRHAQTLQRRRSRQLLAVEAVGEMLAREGPTPAALDGVVGLLDDVFGYHYPSIYTWDGHALQLGAQRNYEAPIASFPTDKGVIGRVARTREPIFLPDVTLDPDYVAARNDILGEISVPMLGQGELLGVVNIEMPGPRRLDEDDYATMKIVADRLGVSLALGRERQKLTERATLMDALVRFSHTLGGSLDPETVTRHVAAGAARVIGAEMLTVIVREPSTGDFRVAQVEGGDPTILGIVVEPGEGVSGRAIRDGRVVVMDRQERSERPRATRNLRMAETLAAMSAPLRVEEMVVGALTWVREDLNRPFSEQEQEVAALLAAQVALAIVNAELHHATEVAAVTDALTGLANRRHFDASIARADAARRRQPPADRRKVAAIIFDLDHFGQMNKLYGHQVGDRVLRAFADVVRGRVRTSDLAARYGGEEFVVILEGATLDGAVQLAEDIRVTFEALRFDLPDGTDIGSTASGGCAALEPSEVAIAQLLERADVGLAMAKASGRNRVVAA